MHSVPLGTALHRTTLLMENPDPFLGFGVRITSTLSLLQFEFVALIYILYPLQQKTLVGKIEYTPYYPVYYL